MSQVEAGVEIDEEVFQPGESEGTVIRLSLTAALGGFLFGYDSAIINGAVKAITAHFSATAGVLGFVVASALLGAAVGALAAGRVVDGMAGCSRCGRSARGVSRIVCRSARSIDRKLVQFELYRPREPVSLLPSPAEGRIEGTRKAAPTSTPYKRR